VRAVMLSVAGTGAGAAKVRVLRAEMRRAVNCILMGFGSKSCCGCLLVLGVRLKLRGFKLELELEKQGFEVW